MELERQHRNSSRHSAIIGRLQTCDKVTTTTTTQPTRQAADRVRVPTLGSIVCTSPCRVLPGTLIPASRALLRPATPCYARGMRLTTDRPDRFWRSCISLVAREPRGALEDCLTLGRNSTFADTSLETLTIYMHSSDGLRITWCFFWLPILTPPRLLSSLRVLGLEYWCIFHPFNWR